jgi:hypothetical protein
MSEVARIEIEEYREEVRNWFTENKPQDLGFLLPETFMEASVLLTIATRNFL